MQITRLKLKNWRNFRSVDIPLWPRTYVIGANASGKSNLLDVFRFLRTLAQTDGGGLQKALCAGVQVRGQGAAAPAHQRGASGTPRGGQMESAAGAPDE